MKKFLLTLLAIVVIVGALAGVGFMGYRLGIQQTARLTAKGATVPQPQLRGHDFGGQPMPFHNFRDGMGPGFQRGFGMMGHGRGFGFGFGIFALFRFFIEIAVIAFVLWVIYKLLTGWRFSFTRVNAESPKAQVVEPVQSQTTGDTETK